MKLSLLFFFLGALLFVPKSRADQFAYVDRAICTNAISYISEDSIVLSYCSQCDRERVEVWRVKQSFVADVQFFDHFQLTLFVEKLFRSKPAFDSGHYAEPVTFSRVHRGATSVEGVDLAYLYIQKPDGSFHVLAKEMALDPIHCAVETIKLPSAFLKKLKRLQASPAAGPSQLGWRRATKNRRSS
jgi:hypothetical protein